MKTKNILLIAFVIVALIQLVIPAHMIWEKEEVLKTGTLFKFETEPIDPTDPFIGKYIVLNYAEDQYITDSGEDLSGRDHVFVSFTTGDDGFAKISTVTPEKPVDTEDYVRAKLRGSFITKGSNNRISIDYPFDRYYMEESKAYDAELAYRESQRDTSSTTYALVYVKDGTGVLKDVLIDDVPIRELVKEVQQKTK